MRIEYFENDDLTNEQRDCLISQNVSMDDWDYLLIIDDIAQFIGTEEKVEIYNYDTRQYELKVEKRYSPLRWHLDQLLCGCCSNQWSKIIWESKEVIVGIAYHS